MKNTLDNIKTLQDRESSLYSSLGVSADGSPLDSSGQEKILDEINSLTSLRVNLIQEMENQYNLLNVNVKESNNDIADELASIEVMEQQLNDKKKELSKLKNIEVNKLRMADINHYYANRNEYVASIYYAVVLILVAVCVVLVARRLLPFVPSAIFTALLTLVLLSGGGFISYKVVDLYSRDKMNFDEYDYSNLDPKVTRPSVYEYNVQHLKGIRDILVNQEKQMEGTIGAYFGGGNDSDYLAHQCNTDDGKVYLSANSTHYSTTNKSMKECQNDCSADENCEMFLMSDDNTCNLYKNVSKVSTYCSAGSGHSLWGKVKKQKKDASTPAKKETFMNISSAFVPHDQLSDNNYDLNLLH